MCGIAGYFGPTLPNKKQIANAENVLKHRGPNGHGNYTNISFNSQNVLLLHTRLAIIDLDRRSNQPFKFDGGVLIFNGEIYNYIELRISLKALGHSFKTEGDTEVLAHAIREWGIGAIDRLEGMWAFAWYEESDGSLLLCRDRFGEKPLYVWPYKGGLYFASEIKGLAALAGEWPRKNHNHLLRYLVNGYKALYKTEETFYEGVTEIPISTCVVLSQGQTQKLKYWNPTISVNENMTYEDAVYQTRTCLLESMRIRLRSDVPIAFCMSGGIDSNSLIASASRVFGCDIHGFTIVNTDSRYEEQEMVELAVKDLGIKHTSIQLNQKNFIKNLKNIINKHDAPLSTISYYAQWQLMQAIAENGYKVSISGTGADELFTGYYDHHNLYLNEVSDDIDLYSSSLKAWKKHVRPIVRNPYLQDPDLYKNNNKFRDHIYLNNNLFTSWLKNGWSEEFVEKNYGLGLLRNRMLNELFAEAVPVMLHEDDLNSMAFSIENRSPFLDRNLFDVAYSIPSRYLVRDGRAKAILRDSMRNIVPTKILKSRRKVGFNAPIQDIIDLGDQKVREYLLDDGPVYDIVNKQSIYELLKQKKHPNSISKFLFNFINVKIFLEEN